MGACLGIPLFKETPKCVFHPSTVKELKGTNYTAIQYP